MLTMKINPAHPKHYQCSLNELSQFDDIIDVRTPKEFADDHLPGAINAPVLSNEERVLVGTMYKQESAYKATRVGAALVARNIAHHLETQFADRPKKWRPLIYCWRGGKRSGSMANWFNLIGWHASQLDGGYKAWRSRVVQELKVLPPKFRFIVLAGPTGSGKTRLLNALQQTGAQTLDLEAIACHRGSLLGGLPDCEQPSQRAFETGLYQALSQFDARRPVFVEAESRRIGHLDLPTELLDALHQGQCVRVQAAMKSRIGFLLQDYQHLFDQPDAFKQKLTCLTQLQGHKTIAQWKQFIDRDERANLFLALVEKHYDPAYRRSSNKHFNLTQALVFDYDPLAPNGIEQAQQLIQQVDML